MAHQALGPVLLGSDELAVVQAKLLAFTTKVRAAGCLSPPSHRPHVPLTATTTTNPRVALPCHAMPVAQMLERKEMLLNTLREMNQQAEFMSAPAAVRHPSIYSATFRQQYSWVVNALNKTNIALNPALEKLRLTVFADAQSTARRALHVTP